MSPRTLFARAPRVRSYARLRLEPLDDRNLPSGYVQTNLASDIPGQAQVHDPELVDAWGISINPNGTFWVSGRATDVSTVYRGDVTRPDGSRVPFVKSPLTVGIPGGAPTGQVFNGSNDFVVTAPRPPAPISDPVGDFLPGYTGPADPGLDVVAHEARIVGDSVVFYGKMAGPIAPTQALGGLCIIGVDRGQGTPRFAGRTPVIGPNVLWDSVVRVNPDGTGLFNNIVGGVVTPLDRANITINGNEFTARVPLSAMLPGATRPPEQWTYNLWPRNSSVIGNNAAVPDLAPDDGNSPVRGMVSAPAVFIFASETGHITGWNPAVPTGPVPASRHAFIMASTPGAVYTGLAIGNNGSGNFLYAADFAGGKIDVFDRAYAPTTLSGSFVDPAVPADYDPFNIWNLGGKLYVAYARQTDGDALPDGGHGYVSVFDMNGNLLSHLVEDSHVKEPWGMALAPANFGEFSNALLVANTHNGKINAYDPTTGAFLGRLADASGEMIHIDGLWALHFGNGTVSGDRNALYFTAAPKHHEHGLFGSLRVAPPSVAAAMGMGGESLTDPTGLEMGGVISDTGGSRTVMDGMPASGGDLPTEPVPASGTKAAADSSMPVLDDSSADGLGLEEEPHELG